MIIARKYDFKPLHPKMNSQIDDILAILENLDNENFQQYVNMEGVNYQSLQNLGVTSITIGAYTLNVDEWANLDGLDQALNTTSDVTFNDVTITTPSNIYLLSHDAFADFVANEHIDWTNATQSISTTGNITISGTGLMPKIIGSDLFISGVGKIGSSANNSEFESDGTLKFNGDATVWTDYVTPLTKATFGGAANDPTLTKIFDDGAGSGGVWALVFGDGDEVLVTVQMPHSWKLESTIFPHIHIVCLTDVTPTDHFAIEFEYTWCDQDEDFAANTTLETIDEIDTGINTQYKHQLVNIPTAGIDGTGHTLSSILMCRIKRVAASTDNYAGGIAILDFDVHYEIDTVGSRLILTK